ncbi:hypothetical protein BO85DRAFT_480185 [Aspergillus piperis CBS 112811]|uniref:Tc toxin complex TcA C-terminal TcB-binding domain-containing protein n=1 Tax=Aspergillus piperis CBS 112811 TaxID=1448313 RepID=A0A8G1VIM1_9EURO|nr:hypothetical protein BO85DRAFT_480185 [Aspergillus piperis CBS 112811]RAH54694.1 hypothetical protein BO85DRAFT_480185 [Aspergillus piperis CBS 112811]
MSIQQALSRFYATFPIREESFLKRLESGVSFRDATRTVFYRHSVIDLEHIYTEVQTKAKFDIYRLLLYCDTLLVPKRTNILLPKRRDEFRLVIFARDIQSDGLGSEDGAFAITMDVGDLVAFHTIQLPENFCFRVHTPHGTEIIFPKIDDTRYGVEVECCEGHKFRQKQRPPPEDVVLHDYLETLENVNGIVRVDENLNDNLQRIFSFQFLLAAFLIQESPVLALQILNYVCKATAMKGSFRFFYESATLRDFLVSQLDSHVFSISSVNIYGSKQILKSRLKAAEAFDSSFQRFIGEGSAAENFRTNANILLSKSRMAMEEYECLWGFANREYTNALNAEKRAKDTYRSNQINVEQACIKFREGLDSWERKEKVKAVVELIKCGITTIGAVVGAFTTSGASLAAADPIELAEKAQAVVGKFKRLVDIIKRIQKFYNKWSPVLTSAWTTVQSTTRLVNVFREETSTGPKSQFQGLGDPNIDVENCIADWRKFNIDVDLFKKELEGNEIAGLNEYYKQLKYLPLSGEAVIRTRANLISRGYQLTTANLRRKLEKENQPLLESTVTKAETNHHILEVLQDAMFDRLLTVRAFVMLDFWTYRSAYMYHSLSSGFPIVCSPVKFIGDYFDDAATLQSAITEYGSSTIVQKKVFQISVPVDESERRRFEQGYPLEVSIGPEQEEFQPFIRIRLHKVRCYLRGLQLSTSSSSRPLGLLLYSQPQFYDRQANLDSNHAWKTTHRLFIGSSRTVLFETRSVNDQQIIICDGDYGQRQDYTMYTPMSDWTISLAPGCLSLEELDVSGLSAIELEFWCDVTLDPMVLTSYQTAPVDE